MSLKNVLNVKNYQLLFGFCKSNVVKIRKFSTKTDEKNSTTNDNLSVDVVGNLENTFLAELKDPSSTLFKPALPVQSFSLAPYVNHSETLQKLVKLGVNLHHVEKDTNVASLLVKSDFKRDIQPLIFFLYHNKVPADSLGHVLSKNSDIFKEPIDKLQLRIDYLLSKNFSSDSIVRIILKIPQILTTSTIFTDKQLGFLQLMLKLTGDEVRNSVTQYPKIILWDSTTLESNLLFLRQTLGFEADEVKELYLQEPKLLVAGKHAVASRFDYLHNHMFFSHQELVQCPQALLTRLSSLQQRYSFLKFLGRVQFDKSRPQYVPLRDFCCLPRDVFCHKIAKTPPSLFYEFLKTL